MVGRRGVIIPVAELEVFYPVVCAGLDVIRAEQDAEDAFEVDGVCS